MKTEILIEMLKFRRLHGSRSIRQFEKRFLRPIFGAPDMGGNYLLDIGETPNLIFAAHFDSVHRSGGMQKLQIVGDIVTLARDEKQSNCLGADCATGIWLILAMIEAGVGGRYIIHAQEETGGIGADWIVENRPLAYKGIDSVISFDRFGTSEIITHQSGGRTASDDFARSLASVIGLPLSPSDRGSFTDSYCYANDVSECTNLAVGYRGQHTKSESQDLAFAELLRDCLICADWSLLRFSRKAGQWDSPWPSDCDYPEFNRARPYQGWGNTSDETGGMSIVEMVENYPDVIGDILESLGYCERSLAEAIAESYFAPRQFGRKS